MPTTKIKVTCAYTEEATEQESKHSIYTHCWECNMWGINFPNDKVCGNCSSEDTTTYYPLEDRPAEPEKENVENEIELRWRQKVIDAVPCNHCKDVIAAVLDKAPL